MKIKVRSCWGGANDFTFELSIPNGERLYIPRRYPRKFAGYWNKYLATKALNALESLYGMNRKNIRFIHI